ncbi:MAG: RagB/SusD family nutrient uptake outer membrane protein [Bacteroidetes bacterium]|nr:RagB/SusD family nutrient uptake outer membrane protein [Bacteroidota bacterium]MCH8523370.1 RagB/SusD family nutrient uptake outer membrane protein [Balneolales bacterium]
MKKIKIYVLALFVGVAFTACDDLLDLDPQASISDDIALSTPGNIQTAVVGGYAALGGSNAYGGSYIYLTDIYAAPQDEVNFNGTFIQPREVNEKAILTTNSYIAGYWSTSYNIINRANNVLSALDVIENANTRQRLEAEAKFLRAVAYYNLVKVFGRAYNDGDPSANPGVPLITTPTRVIDETLQVERASVAAVYQQIIQDLSDARDNLPPANSFFASEFTASAMLARVYLTMGNYALAGAEANRVIESGRFSLFSDIRDNFNRNNDGAETIFAVQNSATSFSHDMAVFYSPLPYGRADIQIRDAHLATYEAGDLRGTLFIDTGGRGRMITRYHSDDSSIDPRRTNITVIRLAEMHLIRAEANVRLTGSGVAGIGGVTPVADINPLRERVDLAPLATATLEDVLRERRAELAFEGHKLADLKRLEGTTNSGLRASIPWNDPLLVFPIPNRETLVNENLVLNPGYN